MSDTLNDRLKNEYSTQYTLVIGENSFYPDASSLSTQEKAEKISESAVAGLNYEVGGSSPPTKVDPFRQAAGKLWSFKGNSTGNNTVKFYDNYANIGNSNKYIAISNKYKEEVQAIGYSFASTAVAAYEDVSDQWGEFFATEVYPGSISLKRKATRLKLKFPSDDLLQNRLSMLSLISDINKKNQPVAYQNLGGSVIDALKQEKENLKTPELNLSNAESIQADIDSKLETLKKIGEYIPIDIAGPNGPLGYTVFQVENLFPVGWSGDSLEGKRNDYQALRNVDEDKGFFANEDKYEVEIGTITGESSTNGDQNEYEAAKVEADRRYKTLIYSKDLGTTYKDSLKNSDESGELSKFFGAPPMAQIKNFVDNLVSMYIYEIGEFMNPEDAHYYPTGLQRQRVKITQIIVPEFQSDEEIKAEEDNGFTILAFKNWLETKTKSLKLVIEIKELEVKKAAAEDAADTQLLTDQAAFGESQTTLDAEIGRVEGLYIAFQQSSNYNYDAVLAKGKLNVNTDEYTNLDNIPTDNSDIEYYTNQWQGLSLNGLGQAVLNGQLDSFYNPATNDYSYDTRTLYKDTSFSMQLPMSPKAMSLVNTPNKNELFVDIKASYNYYSEFYENGTKQDKYINSLKQEVPFSELEMPLIYAVPLDEDGTASAETEDILNTKFKFDKFGHKLLNCGYEDDAQSNKNLNIILDQNSKQFLDNYDNVKTQFPFYVDFKFKSDANKDFATLFNSTGMTNQLVKTWISNFFYSDLHGKNPDKMAPITKFGEENMKSSFVPGYYDPFDPNKLLNGTVDGQFKAGICKDEIYKIDTTKDFYKIIPPETSEDFHNIGDQLVRETTPDYNVREFDLNKWLDGYIKSIAGNTSYASWVEQVIGDETGNSSATVSKTFSDSGDFFTSGDELEKAFKAVIFLGKYRQLVDQKSRNYYDIMNKDLAYSETLFYRVQKVAVGDGANIDDGPLVQNFWLIKPNDKENQTNSDVMRYIDTQVKYDQDYEYTVYAYQLVVGTRYGFQFENKFSLEQYAANAGTPVSDKMLAYQQSVEVSALNENCTPGDGSEKVYEDNQTQNFNSLFQSANNQSDDRLAIFDVVCEPDVKLIEMPFYKKKVVISDAASTAPEVDIIPLRGQDNEIKINFYPSSVSREMIPIIIKPEDYPKFGKIRKAQDRALFKMAYAQFTMMGEDGIITLSQTSEDYFSQLLGVEVDLASLVPDFYVEEKLIFKNDDFATHYEIYRMEETPNSYMEFGDNLLTTINAQELSSLTDKIEQNKKYYYMFRSLDVHGNISNPSPIYQVEMVENSGAVYPVISIYQIEQQKIGSKTKPFRRYLKIDAAAMQGILDLKGSELKDADSAITNKPIKLGEKNTKLFSASDSLSHKKFKFRVKSRHTGKIIDLNVSFKIRKLEPEAIISCGDEVTAQEFAGIVKVKTGVGSYP